MDLTPNVGKYVMVQLRNAAWYLAGVMGDKPAPLSHESTGQSGKVERSPIAIPCVVGKLLRCDQSCCTIRCAPPENGDVDVTFPMDALLAVTVVAEKSRVVLIEKDVPIAQGTIGS